MTTALERAVVDTNVLVYAVFPAMPDHAASRALLDTANAAGTNLYVAPQNLIEFFAVVTDPRRVTQPRTPDEALQAIDDLLALPGLALVRFGTMISGLSRESAQLAHSHRNRSGKSDRRVCHRGRCDRLSFPLPPTAKCS
jgi:predicted nucleic acid-binding protein